MKTSRTEIMNTILNFLKISYEVGVGFTAEPFGNGIDVHDVTRRVREIIKFSPSQSAVIADQANAREIIKKESFESFLKFADSDSAMNYSRKYRPEKDELLSSLLGEEVPKQGVKITTKGGAIGFHYTNEPTQAQRARLENIITAVVAEIKGIGDTAPYYYIVDTEKAYAYNKKGGFIGSDTCFNFNQHEPILVYESDGYGDFSFVPRDPGVYELRGESSWFMKPKGGFAGLSQHDYQLFKIGDL